MSESRPDITFCAKQQISAYEESQIFNIHLRSLPDDVLPNFGIGVTQRYLQSLMQTGAGGVILARTEGTIVGFVVLRTEPVHMVPCLTITGLARFMARSLRRPGLMIRLIAQLLYRVAPPSGCAEIDYFAVDVSHRGAGVGAQLLSHAEIEAARRGCTGIFTKTSNAELYRHYCVSKQATLLSKRRILDSMYHHVWWPV